MAAAKKKKKTKKHTNQEFCRIQADTAWKEVLARWFQPFMEGYFPDISGQIDWDSKREDLSQELPALKGNLKKNKRIIDKLFQVGMNAHPKEPLLIHIEVQGNEQKNFSERLFEYSYRIYHRYRYPLLSFVILSDARESWHPKSIEVGAFGYKTFQHHFFSIKLLDWKDKEEQLLESNNPFDSLIAIHLIAEKTRYPDKKSEDFDKDKYDQERYKLRFEIYRKLLSKDWKEEDMHAFIRFLECIIRLPDLLEMQYNKEVYQLEEEMNKKYITSAEYFGRQEGLQLGEKKATYGIAKSMVQKGTDNEYIAEVTGLSAEEIENLK